MPGHSRLRSEGLVCCFVLLFQLDIVLLVFWFWGGIFFETNTFQVGSVYLVKGISLCHLSGD